jgi:RsiW-degrading membrane proteinase PrsW (M82 family)
MATHHHIDVKKTISVAVIVSIITWMAMKFPTYAAHATGALLGGILPALFWLWFWLREDKAHPEPKKIIFEAFIFGIIAVPFAIFFEKLTFVSFEKMTVLLFFTWAVIEEVFKYCAAFLAGIRTEYFDEPIDVVMYMISSALGFSAGENILFIYNSFNAANMSMIPLRFIGASLLHVACSALIGFGIGFGVGKKNSVRFAYLFTGLTLAFALHTAFNYFIMDTGGKSLLRIFALVWAVIVFIIILFEKIKRSPYYLASIQ